MYVNDQTIKPPSRLKTWLFKRFGLTNKLIIKAYHGYAYGNKVILHGHVFKLSPISRKKYRKSVIRNTLALLRLFIVKPYPFLPVELQYNGVSHFSESGKDGFFKFEWTEQGLLPKGWQEVIVSAKLNGRVMAISSGKVYVPYGTQYGFISDIDDTFLISHSSNLWKRLFVLFTQNARTRKPFADVVNHYQLLAKGNTTVDALNPFFYVSSSEWNLYDYIREFTIVNKIPEGVFLLNQLKILSELLKTGQNNHKTKFTRISRILEHYPQQTFILLGDSSQQDPYIYASIAEHFPKQIRAVYIRDIYQKNKERVDEVLTKISSAGIPCYFFKHSSEAIQHSLSIGLINAGDFKQISTENNVV